MMMLMMMMMMLLMMTVTINMYIYIYIYIYATPPSGTHALCLNRVKSSSCPYNFQSPFRFWVICKLRKAFILSPFGMWTEHKLTLLLSSTLWVPRWIPSTIRGLRRREALSGQSSASTSYPQRV